MQELVPFRSLIVATGGGVVTRNVNWGHMHHGVVVWLRGAPELLAARVVAEGARSRPLVAHTEVLIYLRPRCDQHACGVVAASCRLI